MPFLVNRRILFAGYSALCIGLFSLYGKSEAVEADFISKTFLQIFEDAADNGHAPFYEYVELNLRNLKEKKLSFYAAGWLRYDLKALSNPQREMDELSYAYLRYAPFENRSLLFNIGRQRITEGMAAVLMDGLSARWEISRLTGFSIFGGRSVETEFDGKKGDFLYGGRLFQRIERKAELGFSFLREDNDGSRFREELGLDLWLLPLREAEVLGRSSYSTVTDGWMEHSYVLRVFPAETLTVSGLFTHTDYRHAFSTSTLSAFLPEFLGQNEEMTKAGASVEYRIGRDLTVIGDYVGYGYRQSGDAKYLGGGVVAKTYGASLGASVHRMSGSSDRLRYTELRLYGKKDLNPVRFSADALVLHYDTPFSGLSNAYWVNGTVEYKVTDSMTAGLSLDYLKSPDFTHDTRVLLRLAYDMRKRQR